MEESAEYAVGDRYGRGAQEGEGAEPGDSAATADESTTVLLMPDLMISLRDVFASATAGDRITFEYTIRNDGPSDATRVTVIEVLADGLHLLPSGADPSDCSVSGREVTCRIGNLASGESRLLSVTLVLDPSAVGNLVNAATVSGAEAEFDKSNNTVSSTIPVTPLADLELKRTDLLGSNSNNHEHEDDQIINEFRITNNGPSDATNVVLTNELIVDVVLVSLRGSQVSCTVISGTVVCDLGDLANGESVTFTIVLARVTGGKISSKVGATSDQSVTSTLDPWEFFLDLSGPDSDLTPASALLESVVGSSNNLLVASGLLGLALTALALILGNNVFTGNGRRTETEA